MYVASLPESDQPLGHMSQVWPVVNLNKLLTLSLIKVEE